MLEVKFYGVRGSTPCSGPETAGVGGNTSCVTVTFGDEPPVILDLGTGLRYLGAEFKEANISSFTGTALVSHLHWDHVQGIPFFAPLMHAESQLTIVGPRQETGTLEQAIHRFISPPLFPVVMTEIPGVISFVETSEGQIEVGSLTVSVTPLLHVGNTNGYKLTCPGGGSVAYISDHQEPVDAAVPADVVEFCRDVDVLIHDAQYDSQELLDRHDWGHSTPSFAVKMAQAAGAKRLVLFHHDPSHDDAWIASATAAAQAQAGDDIEVIAGVEGLALTSGT